MSWNPTPNPGQQPGADDQQSPPPMGGMGGMGRSMGHGMGGPSAPPQGMPGQGPMDGGSSAGTPSQAAGPIGGTPTSGAGMGRGMPPPDIIHSDSRSPVDLFDPGPFHVDPSRIPMFIQRQAHLFVYDYHCSPISDRRLRAEYRRIGRLIRDVDPGFDWEMYCWDEGVWL